MVLAALHVDIPLGLWKGSSGLRPFRHGAGAVCFVLK
jgi:hypothetical protein